MGFISNEYKLTTLEDHDREMLFETNYNLTLLLIEKYHKTLAKLCLSTNE